MDTIVSFKLAKLLKEERFNEPIKQRYFIAENIDSDRSPFLQKECALYNWNNYDDFSTSYYSAPTIAEVIMWLYEKHGIRIFILPQDKSIVDYRVGASDYPSLPLFLLILKYEKDLSIKEVLNSSDPNSKMFLHFDEPTEAYEAAIEYTLENLI